MTDCIHKWIANSGQGGEPKFSTGNDVYHGTTHVKCSKCNSRTWLTASQWDEHQMLGMPSGEAEKWIQNYWENNNPRCDDCTHCYRGGTEHGGDDPDECLVLRGDVFLHECPAIEDLLDNGVTT